jgi:3-hydroxyisobutyrate dehydrogenase-like beta-hydroxyacid dehydrogenase
MAAGSDEAFAQVEPLLRCFGKNVFHVGLEPGQGQVAKLLNNLLSATAMAITSEALAVGLRAGLEPDTLLDVFNAGSGRNTATSDKFPTHVLPRTFGSGFRLALMAKDVELCLAEARAQRVPVLVGGHVQQLWTLAAAAGAPDADHTEFVRLIEGWTGETVAGTSRSAA